MTTSPHNKIISVDELWQFFNHSANLFCIAGNDGYLKEVNPYVVKLLGYAEEELLSIPYLHFVHEQDRDFAGEQSALVLREGGAVQFQTRVLSISGGVKWISWTATYVQEGDSVYLIGQDLTERVAAVIGIELHDNII